ncbi:MAG: hypothetical protein J5696_00800 [Lachnospiraceae bacterium]|nr:hypothetical protein [Lachnospiraceae bacterium]
MMRILKKIDGSVGDVMPMGLFVICIAIVFVSFAECVRTVNIKSSVSQISRRYILRMETVGYLTPDDSAMLFEELGETGLHEISLGNTDTSEVGYGNPVRLEIRGFTEDGYEISEYRTSTAKY